MATIKNKLSGEELILHRQHTIGRDQNNIKCLEESDISRKHAIIYWENNHWLITDFSSNGTKINHAHLQHATKKLKKNDFIQFSNCEKEIWELINLDKPNSFLKTNINCIDLGKGIIFSKQNETKLALFLDKHQHWIMDDGESEIPLINGERYLINGIEYEFIENECLANTCRNMDITKNACFQFYLSADEEHVSSHIKINDLILDLGDCVYNHLLLYLARAKQLDFKFGLNSETSGWVYIENITVALSKELLRDIDTYYINILIHRLRKKLMNLPPYGYLFNNTIERKRGKLRFGFTNFKIEKEQMLA